mmetsp:Transcript_18071/g.28025  ORF Transcript_18071/g.28025 Transcript_18071/m.28025 type:complete len:107 (-) Transcript_18071:288-608(-)
MLRASGLGFLVKGIGFTVLGSVLMGLGAECESVFRALVCRKLSVTRLCSFSSQIPEGSILGVSCFTLPLLKFLEKHLEFANMQVQPQSCGRTGGQTKVDTNIAEAP